MLLCIKKRDLHLQDLHLHIFVSWTTLLAFSWDLNIGYDMTFIGEYLQSSKLKRLLHEYMCTYCGVHNN